MRLNDQDSVLVAKQFELSDSASAVFCAVAQTEGPIKTPEIQGRLPAEFISRQHLIRLIGGMVDGGILRKIGGGPQTAYTVNERVVLNAYLNTDWLFRSEKPFDMGVIETYRPNHSRYLSVNDAAQMRQESLAAIPVADTLSEVVFRRFMVDFAWSSSRLEGNTYSLLQTRDLLEKGIVAPGKSENEARMIRNHGEAITYVIENARDITLSPIEVRSIHAMLSKGLLPDSDNEGRVRQSIVEISGTAYRPEASPHVLSNGLQVICDKANEISDPFEASIFLLEQLSYLQAFIDVNKRTARVVASLPLLRAGLCPLSFYGMNEESYTKGLVAFYELNDSTLMVDAYREGYRSSVERFKTYKRRLSDESSSREDAYRTEAEGIVARYINLVALGEVMPDSHNDFFRQNITESDPFKRDALFLEARRQLGRIDQPAALAMGVSRKVFMAYLFRTEGIEIMQSKADRQDRKADTPSPD
jgi:Fic family protein